MVVIIIGLLLFFIGRWIEQSVTTKITRIDRHPEQYPHDEPYTYHTANRLLRENDHLN
jgi:hypothetical protein